MKGLRKYGSLTLCFKIASFKNIDSEFLLITINLSKANKKRANLRREKSRKRSKEVMTSINRNKRCSRFMKSIIQTSKKVL